MQGRVNIKFIAFHIFVWALFFIYPILSRMGTPCFHFVWSETLLKFCCYAIGVYVNWYLLLPLLFLKKKWFTYLFALAAMIMLIEAGYCFINHRLIQHCQCSLWNCIQNNLIEFSFLIALFMVFHLVNWYHHKDIAYEHSEKKRVEAELNWLKSQINPHYLFNSLNAIYSYSLDNSPKAPAMILKLSDSLRYVLYESNLPEVALKKDIDYLQNYIAIQQMRNESRIDTDFQVTGDTDGLSIAPMLLIPFVENVFKHGFYSITDKVTVKIYVLIDKPKGLLTFHTENLYKDQEDDGSVFTRSGSGIGMENVRRRLQLLYPDRHELRVDKTDGIFIVHLVLQLRHAGHAG